MTPYVWKRRADGVNIINIHKTYSKLVLAARIIATIPNPADVCVVSQRQYGHRAVLKFAAHTGASAIAGRFTPGNFTNYITRSFKEPRLIIATDPRTDAQAIKEASDVNIPVISLADLDSPLAHVDVAIPTNNKGPHAIGLIWWLLAREVLRLRGSISRSVDWEIMPDLYFYRDPEEEREEKEEEEGVSAAVAGEQAAVAQAISQGAGNVTGADWDVSAAAPGQPGAVDPALAGAAQQPVAGSEQWASSDWAQPQAPSDWAATEQPTSWA